MIRLVLLLAVFAAAHNCKILTVAPDYESVVITCGDWKGGMQSYRAFSKSEWAALVRLDTTVIPISPPPTDTTSPADK